MKGLLARLKQGSEEGQVNALQSERQLESPSTPKKLLLGHFLNSCQGTETPDSVLQNGTSDFPDTPPAFARSEDLFAIKMVRNCNNSESSPSNDAKSPSGGKLGKELSFSVNTLDNDKDEPELICLGDDDDEYETPRVATQPSQAWDMFQDSIRHIDDNVEVFTKKPKPNFLSSEKFKSVMIDMYGDTEYGSKKRHTKLLDKFGGLSKRTGLATRAIFNAKQKSAPEAEETKDENDGSVNEDGTGASTNGVKSGDEMEQGNTLFARRGWKMVKRQVNETSMETNTASSKLQWTTLKQTLKGMTNTDRTRQDLYERYGIIPIVKPDGTSVQENTMLSERAKAEMAKKSNSATYLSRRPQSYHHPVSYSRASSHMSHGSEAGRDSLPPKSKSKSKLRQRPMTSKR